jgi:hypothetical protein
LSPPRIDIYKLEATGTLTRTDTIAGPNTGLYGVGNIAFDAGGWLSVISSYSYQSPAILTYAPGATGNVRPAGIIKGPGTGLNGAAFITF